MKRTYRFDGKEHLLNTAEETFSRYGYKATTVRLIAARAGTNASMINYYFSSKDNLLFAVINRRLKDFEQAIIYSLSVRRKPVQMLSGFIHTTIDLIFENRQFFRFLSKELHGDLPEESTELVDIFFRSMLSVLKNMLDDGNKRKELKCPDTELTGYAVICTLVHTIIDDRFGIGETEEKRKKRIQQFFDAQFVHNQITYIKR